MTSKITYVGNLRTSSEHLQSGTIILTDAPTDNQGQGASFSPTDLVANALGACIITIMAIKARDLNVIIDNSTAEITKIMGVEPRRIAKIGVLIKMVGTFDQKTKLILERTAMTCPVHMSLHPGVEQEVIFEWD